MSDPNALYLALSALYAGALIGLTGMTILVTIHWVFKTTEWYLLYVAFWIGTTLGAINSPFWEASMTWNESLHFSAGFIGVGLPIILLVYIKEQKKNREDEML